MSTLPHVHLCIVQPAGYVHSLGFLDQARYFRHQFKRMGATVSLAKNRLRHDAVNIVFGAHLGFDAALRERHTCVFVNLEQMGQGGAALPAEYTQLLATSAVIDYDAGHISAYTAHVDDVPVVPFLHAPYLRPERSLPLAERPIDVLFIGSLNERRRAMLDRIEATGAKVVLFDSPLYGPERDQFILQAKCVFNAHFYATSRFEQARVSHCLSLGTPVVSERAPQTQPHPAFEDAVFWVPEAELETFFTERFASNAFEAQAQAMLSRFAQHDPIDDYAEALAFAAGYARGHQQRRPTELWRPTRINLGSGKDYKPGWLNIDVLDRAQPDLVLDLGQSVQWPVHADTPYAGPLTLSPASVDMVYANNVLEHVPDLPMLMGNCLSLLKTGGHFLLEVPYEHAATAWQDPTHLRALNEKSWLYYTDWFWYLGWFEHRFQVDNFQYLDDKLQVCERPQAAFMRVLLTKIETTLKERNTARVMRADFALPDDIDTEPDQQVAQEAALPLAAASSLTPARLTGPAQARSQTIGRSLVECGAFTYGTENLSVRQWGEGAALRIGAYGSIASNVTIFLGGNHRSDWVSTFPFGHIHTEVLGGEGIVGHPATRGDVTIGNDVWIGHGVTIMSGVTVGDGAILAANAHVVKDVAPYEIVGGNPAQHVAWRFDEGVRAALLQWRWWELPVETVRELTSTLCAAPHLPHLQALMRQTQAKVLKTA